MGFIIECSIKNHNIAHPELQGVNILLDYPQIEIVNPQSFAEGV